MTQLKTTTKTGFRHHSKIAQRKTFDYCHSVTLWYTHVRVSIRGLQYVIAQKFCVVYFINEPL